MNQETGQQQPDTGQQEMVQAAQGGGMEGAMVQGDGVQAPPQQEPLDCGCNEEGESCGCGESEAASGGCSCGGHEGDGASAQQPAPNAGAPEAMQANPGPAAMDAGCGCGDVQGNPAMQSANPGMPQGQPAATVNPGAPSQPAGYQAAWAPPQGVQPPPQYHYAPMQPPQMAQPQVAPQMGHPQMAPQMGQPQMGAPMGQPQMPGHVSGSGCGHMGSSAQHIYHDENKFGQMADMVGRFLKGEATPTDMVEGIFSLNFRNDQLWKGALLGAAAVLIFNSGVVQNSVGKLFGGSEKSDTDA